MVEHGEVIEMVYQNPVVVQINPSSFVHFRILIVAFILSLPDFRLAVLFRERFGLLDEGPAKILFQLIVADHPSHTCKTLAAPVSDCEAQSLKHLIIFHILAPNHQHQRIYALVEI